MYNKNRRFLGYVFILAGALFLVDRLGFIEFNLFFDGWWTLFLIIPALYSMSRSGITLGNSVLLAIGAVLLFDQRGWNLRGYLLPGFLIVLGLGLVFRRL